MSLLLKKKCCCGGGDVAEACCKAGSLCVPAQLAMQNVGLPGTGPGADKRNWLILRASSVDLTPVGGTSTHALTTGDDHGAIREITVTGSPTGGTYTLRIGTGVSPPVTAPIAYNATAAAVQAAINAAWIATCVVRGPAGGPYLLVWEWTTGNMGLGIQNNSLTGGTSPSVAVAEVLPRTELAPPTYMARGESPCGTYISPIASQVDGTTNKHFFYQVEVTLSNTTTHPYEAAGTITMSANADLSAPFLTLTTTFPLFPVGLSPTVNLTWTRSTGGTVSGTRAMSFTRCCNNAVGGGCKDVYETGTAADYGYLVDPAGRTCCEFRYAEIVDACAYEGPHPPLPGGPYVIDLVRLSQRLGVALLEVDDTVNWVMSIDGARRAVSAYQQARYCYVPSGFTLVAVPNPIELVDVYFGGSPTDAWLCIEFNFCDEAGEFVQTRSFAIAPRVRIEDVHSLWSGCAWACAGGGSDPRALWDGEMPSSGDHGGYLFKTAFTLYGNFTSEQHKITGLECRCYFFSITLVSQCGYWQEVGWDEETEEPIYEWVPPAQYWELLVMLSEFGDCNGAWGVIWAGRRSFDPSDPRGAAGTFAYTPAGYYDYYFNPLPATPLCSGPSAITVTEVV